MIRECECGHYEEKHSVQKPESVKSYLSKHSTPLGPTKLFDNIFSYFQPIKFPCTECDCKDFKLKKEES